MSASFDPRRHADTVIPADPVRVADRPTARLAAALLPDLDPISDAVVVTIREQLQGYTVGHVPRDDLWWSVRASLDALLRMIAEDRTLRPEEVAARSALGTRRARQQLPVDDLTRAYRIAHIEVWTLLTEAARADGQPAVDDLVEVAGHFWAMMHLVSAEIAEAHHETSREQGSEVRRRSLAFLDLLHGLPATADAARAEAIALGLDPDGPVVAAVRPPTPEDDPLRYRDLGVVLAERPDSVVLLSNDEDDTSTFEGEPAPLGVGLARPGLDGALESVRDAEQAHDAARRLGRDVVRFRQDWFACLLIDQAPRLAPLVAEAAAALGDDRTALTIAAYLAHRGSLVQTGEAAGVHPNTVKYRLERFASRTGLDPRDPAQQVDLALALLLAGQPPRA